MAGFQYVALETAVDKDSDQYQIEIIVFALRFLGFITSLGGTMICLVTQEYLKTIGEEKIETQVRGILRYAYFIQMGDYTAILATFLMIVTSNLLLWMNSIPVILAIVFNSISIFFGLLFVRAFYVIIMKRQSSRKLYADADFILAQTKLSEMSICDKFKKLFDSFLWNTA
jgi:hypothetical protein